MPIRALFSPGGLKLIGWIVGIVSLYFTMTAAVNDRPTRAEIRTVFDSMTERDRERDRKLDQISTDVTVLRALACDRATKDTYCRAR